MGFNLRQLRPNSDAGASSLLSPTTKTSTTMASSSSQPAMNTSYSVAPQPAAASYTPAAQLSLDTSQAQTSLSPAAIQTPSTSSNIAGPSTQTQHTAQAHTQAQPSRQQLEEARKDRTLAEFMLMLDDYEPLVRAVSLNTTYF